MINEERVKLMTKLASFEQKENRKVFITNTYLKSDYVSLHVIYTLIFSGIAFFLSCMAVVMLKYNYILGIINSAEIFSLVYRVLIAWVVSEVVFGLIAWVYYRRRYRRYREKILSYVENINLLESMK